MLELNFSPFPILHTTRLLLRQVTPEDAGRLFELRKDVDVLRYIDRPPHRTLDDTNEMIGKISEGILNNEAICWAVTLQGNDDLVGTVSYHRIERENYRAEIGYMLHPS